MTFDAPSDHTTLSEVLAEFEVDGYTGTFEVEEGGAVRCLSCDEPSEPDALDLYAIRRLEGASDPADMAAVLATRCSRCGTRGVIVARYGPEASPGEARAPPGEPGSPGLAGGRGARPLNWAGIVSESETDPAQIRIPPRWLMSQWC